MEKNIETLLAQLNDAQRKAVEYTEGPQLVIAGAGSGKTRVLTYKVAYLLLQGMNPWNILALTFTNKAANEMKERIAGLVGYERARRLIMGTFHSVFSRILRTEAESIGYSSNFTIYDESDSRSLIKNIVRSLGFDDKIYKPATVAALISEAKNRLISAADYAESYEIFERDKSRGIPYVSKIFKIYSERCRNANAMDFDDLLVNTYLLFRNSEEVRRKYAERFAYVLVDEYQDTNFAQHQIIAQLTQEHQHICAVGDDAQSIYSFRGANIDNILMFNRMYVNAKLFKLEQNYRSTQIIVNAANSLIKHNRGQIPKEVYSEKEEGNRLLLRSTVSDREEATVVCGDIKRIMREDGCQYSDFAILYRTNAQSRSFEEEMRKQHIPYKIFGGLSFYQRKEIKDIIAYFRLTVNPNDEEAFRRIVNYPARGIGDVTVGRIAECASANDVSFWEVIADSERWRPNVSKAAMSKLKDFQNLISLFTSEMEEKNAYEIGTMIMQQSGVYKEIFSDTSVEGLSRQENVQEFASALQTFVEERREQGMDGEISLSHFLQEVALISDLDSDDDSTEKVSLMTVHAAKGLEFPTVFVVGMEDNIFPSQRSVDSQRQLEEERRLLYVAITRAERHCILTYAKNRFRYGKMEFGSPSRFLRDIDSKYVELKEESAHGDLGVRPWKNVRSAYSFFPSSQQNSRPVADRFIADPKPRIVRHTEEPKADPFSDSFKRLLSAAHRRDDMPSRERSDEYGIAIGTTIEHQRFGVGVVEKIEGTGENTKATVRFKNTGVKQLLLKFARFSVLK